MNVAKGTFEVKTSPLPSDEQIDSKILGRFSIHKEFSGDMVGVGNGQMLTGMGIVEGSAGYVAMDNITAKLEGKEGSFILQHTGTMSHGIQELVIKVVPDSGNGELQGINGAFKIAMENGKHYYEFEYSFS